MITTVDSSLGATLKAKISDPTYMTLHAFVASVVDITCGGATELFA